MHYWIAGLLLVALSPISWAQVQYTPKDVYNVRSHVLENGLEVYFNERHHAQAVSIRLVVNYGTIHAMCGKRETAHFLEHLLFTGTSKHSEEELDALIEDNGGTWNAVTGEEGTAYEVDIYSPYTELAINTLYEIMTDTQFTEDKVDLTRDIVNREIGENPTEYAQWLYDQDIAKSGYEKASEIIYQKRRKTPSLKGEDIRRNS